MRHVLTLLILVLLGTTTPCLARKRRRRRDRTNARQELRIRRSTCEQDCLIRWLPEEAMNCIHACISPMCWGQIYPIPLEPGQVDLEKADLFNKCTLDEILDRRKKERDERSQSKPTRDDAITYEEQEEGEDTISDEIAEES